MAQDSDRFNRPGNGNRTAAVRQKSAGEESEESRDSDGEHEEHDSEDSGDGASKSEKKKDEKQGDDAPADNKKPFYKRPIPLIVGGVLVLAIVVGAIVWWLIARNFETTDDAFVEAHITNLAPQVAGRVLEVLVDDNQEVTQGQPLVRIDPAEFAARVRSEEAALVQANASQQESVAEEAVAAATVEQSKADVASAEANSANAESTLKRLKSLSAEAVSEQQISDATAAFKAAAAKLEAARKALTASEARATAAGTKVQAAVAAISSAKAQLDLANLNIGYATLVAPRAGRVTRRNVSVGDYLNVGQQVMGIVPNEMWVEANFKETQLELMRPGQSVTIHIDAYPDEDFRGTVNSFQQGTGARFSLLPPENATGNYVKVVQRLPVKITFDDSPEKLKKLAPGMSAVPKVRVRGS